jgi:hypothetical protein
MDLSVGTVVIVIDEYLKCCHKTAQLEIPQGGKIIEIYSSDYQIKFKKHIWFIPKEYVMPMGNIQLEFGFMYD